MSIGLGSLRIGLSRLNGLLSKIIGFFAAGLSGAWEDITSFVYLFQDSAGTTPVTAVEQPVGRVTDRSGNGNHAIQATAASRPLISGNTNSLTKSEQFDDAIWAKTAVTVVANTVVAPDGTMTADTATTTAGGNVLNQAVAVKPGMMFVFSFYAMRGTMTDLKLSVYNLTGGAEIIASTSYFSNTNSTSFSRISVSFTVPAGCNIINVYPLRDSGSVGTFFVWGAQLELGLNLTRYQRVNTATDYDTAGFPKYLTFDGVDDSLSSATGGGGNFGFTWARAVRPTGGAGTMRTLWSDATASGGYKVRINAANQLMLSAGNGTPLAPPVQAAPVNSPTGGTGLAAMTAYFYVVTALNALGESLKSNEATVTTTAGVMDSNTISWAASSGATSYRVYRGTATGAENVFYALGNVTSFVDTGAASTAGSPPLVTETAFTSVSSTVTVGVGTLTLLKAWGDATNLNVQVGSSAVVSIARPTVVAGTTSFTEGKENGVATGFFTGNMYTSIYRTGTVPTAADLANISTYVSQQAGL